MIKKLSILFCLVAITTSVFAQAPKLGKSSVDEVIKAMTLEEKAQLLIGAGMAGFGGNNAVVGATQELVPGAAGTTNPIERLGIPAIVVADGPAGLRIQPTRKNDTQTYYCTAFPVGTLLASTWNTELVESVGVAMGKEVLEYGVDVLLAPALNIHRNPLCGRNFEYYSEDPLISGKMTAAMVRGVQKNGVGTSIKHFAVNNQESNRTANDARVSTRALREIYLKGFEIAVKESNPWTVMSSYNYINGTYASESRGLLTDILRDEWGFKGIVMTDWFGGRNVAAQVNAGNDLLMPGRPDQKDAIVNAVKEGRLDIKDVDVNVKRILELILISPRFKAYKYSDKPDLKAHAIITRQSASEGMVLLKNAQKALPFSSELKKIAAFGTTSYDFISGGTGSGDVNEAYTISLVQGLENAGYTLDANLKSIYETYMKAEKEKNKPDSNNPMSAFMNHPRVPEFIPQPEIIAQQVQSSDVALITIGRNSGEFQDRSVDGDFNLTKEELALIKNVSEAFQKAGKKAIVILNIGGVIETASWKQYPDAILLAWQAGQEGGNSVTDILSGKINPSGKLTMTFPEKIEDVSSTKNFPMGYAPSMQDMMGGAKPSGRPNIDYTVYEEDIFVGYRYYDTFNKNVSYPFGFGLSYTQFAYEKTSIVDQKEKYIVTCTVKNTGNTAGKEIVQLYVSAPGKDMKKPTKELKAFAKTKLLKPGESQTVRMEFTTASLGSFDSENSQWVVEPGYYSIILAASSALEKNIKGNFEIKLPNQLVEKTNNVLTPKENINILK